MNRHRKIWISSIAALSLSLGLWLGIPTFNKWRADRTVDSLCAKDGGVTVYEAVSLPKERFNNLGHPHIPDKGQKKSTDEYFATWTGVDIRGHRSAGSIFDLVIFRGETTYFRQSDEKVVGRLVVYSRRGGDPIGQLHPSLYTCPNEKDLLRSLFVEAKGG